MKNSFVSGAIVAEGNFCERADYDVSNNRITAQFDGRGAVSKYAVMNKFSVFSNFYSIYTFGGRIYDFLTPKRVTMVGRKQTVEFSEEECDVKIIQFLDGENNCIYSRHTVTAKRDTQFRHTVNFGIDYGAYVQQLLANRLSPKTIATLLTGFVKTKRNGLTNEGKIAYIHSDVLGDFYLDFAVSEGAAALEAERGFCNQFSYGGDLKKGESRSFDYVLSAGTKGDFTYCDVKACLGRFDGALAEADAYIADLKCPSPTRDEFENAFYKSSLNAALSNYKELGKFKGFLAGIVYQFPARTYYRDAYWTALAALPVRPDLVRNEIVTLACGINKAGECPSAVKFNFKNYWGNHYDSPSFLVIMLYDYLVHTGDFGVLDEECPCGNVLGAAKLALARLERETDDSGLLVKGGEYNRRDWCDNVFRSGYVTYDEALFARALFGLSEICRAINDGDAQIYRAKFDKVKRAINDLLWDEGKGWFVNYKDGDFVEDNLSIDTVPIILFSLTDDTRARRMLANMQTYLESVNNKEQGAGDFGTLCVWPLYKNAEHVVQKSSLPYYYHNGGDWPYLSCMYAYAKLMYGMDYKYPLERWFEYNVDKGNYTPVEFYSPFHKDGSLLQAWSSAGAFVLSYRDGTFFTQKLNNKTAQGL